MSMGNLRRKKIELIFSFVWTRFFLAALSALVAHLRKKKEQKQKF